MAKEVLKEVKLEVNGVNLSDHASSVTLDDSAEEVEFTSFSTSAYREYGQGLKTSSIEVDFFNDHASGSVAATLQPLYESGGTFSVKVWPTATGTICYTQVSRLYNNPLLAGAVGDANTIGVTFKCGGSLGITRGTA